MLTFFFSGADGRMTQPEVLTTGMVGKQVKLDFTSNWDHLIKTVVFSDGTVVRDAVCTDGLAVIPAEVLTTPLRQFTLGVYGVSEDGELVIPTIRAQGPRILPGVDPSGDEGTDPSLPIWAQIRALIGDLEDLDTGATENLVAAVNELVSVKSEIDSAMSAASTAQAAAIAAQSTVDSAKAAADAAQVHAENAQTALSAAQTTADNALDVANAAQTTANTAKSTADSAKSLASGATTRVNLANSAAAQAQTTANTAQATAEEALALAGQKLDAEGITTETIVTTKEDGTTVTLTVLVTG